MSNGRHSFSAGRRWTIGLNVAMAVAATLALVLMVNYLAARHFARLPVSAASRAPFSPLTLRVLATVTNEVKVVILYERDEPLYDSICSLLRDYHYANRRIVVDSVDLDRTPEAARQVMRMYRLNEEPTIKNLVIFACDNKVKLVTQKQLSELDITPLTSGQSREVKRTHFRGEVEFTSAILSVTSARALKAYFLAGHSEHPYDSEEKQMGYLAFVGVLQENNIRYDRLSLLGTNDVPADCQLLIIAGPKEAFLPVELEKIGRYLKQGGRLLVLFNFESLERPTGLESLLADWGVAVGRNLVRDVENSATGKGPDVIVSRFADHPIMKPLFDSRLRDSRLRLFYPRSIFKLEGAATGADAPSVEVLATTGPDGRVLTDIRPGSVFYERPNDYLGSVPLMVAVEKGAIRNVSAERGSTRMVVVGDSLFLSNELILNYGNREFASHAVNWLLARHDLLVNLPPQPIKNYKLTLTHGQLTELRWIFLLGMPGAVLLAGFVVWLRRRR